jgi:hypothetical protein
VFRQAHFIYIKGKRGGTSEICGISLMQTRPHVLCLACFASDKKDVLAVLADVLQNSGYGTLTAASGSEGLRPLRSMWLFSMTRCQK